MIKHTCAAVTLGLTLTASWAQDINFGIISTESTQNLKADWQPLIDDMAKQTGLKVTAFFAPDYAGIIEGMRFNKVHVAWLGNKSAMEAVDRANAEVFAQMVNADGTQGYYSHLIVHKDSPIKSLDDVLKNGKSLAFGNGDPNSTSGFLVPGFYVFAKNKVDPKVHFKIVRNANHETNALAVANKQVDVATNNSENLDKCVFRSNPPFIPIQTHQPFQFKPTADSDSGSPPRIDLLVEAGAELSTALVGRRLRRTDRPTRWATRVQSAGCSGRFPSTLSIRTL